MDELLELESRLPSQTRTHAETPTELIPRVNLDLSRRREKNNSVVAGIFFSAERGPLLEGHLEPRETCHSLSMYRGMGDDQ
jgi:hypothetical protein